MPSSIGSSGRPTDRIWKKWSMTQMESKPASSAARTTRARVGASCSGPPGHVNELIWSPNFKGDLGLGVGAGKGTAGRGGGPPGWRRGRQRKRSQDAGMIASRMEPSPRVKAAPRTRAAGRPGDLAERQLGGRGELVRHGPDGRLHDPAVAIRGAAQVLDREEAGDADRDVHDPPAPRPPERIGDHHRHVDAVVAPGWRRGSGRPTHPGPRAGASRSPRCPARRWRRPPRRSRR